MNITYSAPYYKKYHHYVASNNLSEIPLFAQIFEWLSAAKPKRVVEIGCGLGYLGDQIGQRFESDVIGLELSPDALEKGRAIYPDSTGVQADALQIPLADRSVDCVLVINVIEHLSENDQPILIAEASRILRVGGSLIISSPDTQSIYAQVMIHDPTHLRELRRQELIDLVADKLTLDEVSYTNSIGKLPSIANRIASFLFPADVIIRAKRTAESRASRDFLSEYLEIYPVAHALARAVEAKALSEVEYVDPMLDLGCGDGTFLSSFFRGTKQVIGIDLNIQTMREAAKTGTYKAVIVADASRMPFASNSFGAVISNSVFEHLYDPASVLGECWRLIDSGGSLIYTVPNAMTREWWFKNRIWRWIKDTSWKHENLASKEWWDKKLHEAEFETVRIHEFANRRLIRMLDILFLPAAIWFVLASLRVRMPLIGRFRAVRSLILRLFEESYWNNSQGEGASFLVQALPEKRSKSLANYSSSFHEILSPTANPNTDIEITK